ncbi:hAT transposon superfamily [Quillaja saponaria]|uniref:HAT transposon superfamily n=1 Tax=Quillaja saponaria TaxID=32244 RepID=A0AAD7PRU3_QUISA|nr:hAT transposon superfamily [Quillaja saponaria]
MHGFSSRLAVKGREKMDPAEWWFLYGMDAPNLRKIALKVLSQTSSSKKLVYAQYNMRLKLKHIMKEKSRENVDFKAIDLTTVFEDNEGHSEWYISVDTEEEEEEDNDDDKSGSDNSGDSGDGGNNKGDGGQCNRGRSSGAVFFTEEQRFNYCTQDTDHGYRPLRENEKHYGRRKKRNNESQMQNDGDTVMVDAESLTSDFSSFHLGGTNMHKDDFSTYSSSYGYRSQLSRYDASNFNYG